MFLSQLTRSSNVGLAYHPRKRTRFGPDGSPSTNDPILSIAQICQSINCWPTFFYQWKRKLATDPKQPQSGVFRTLSRHGFDRGQTPFGIPILVPVLAVVSIAALIVQVEKLRGCLRAFSIAAEESDCHHTYTALI